MQLSKPLAVVFLLATLAPGAYILFFLGSLFWTVFGRVPGEQGVDWFRVLFVLHLVFIVWTWALIVCYLIFLFRSDAVPADKTALWAVVLFFAGVPAMVVFWYLYVWPKPATVDPLNPPGAEPRVAPEQSGN